MADLDKTLNSILSDPEAMEQIKARGEAMGISVPEEKSQPVPQSVAAPSGEMLGMMMKIAPMLEAMNEENDSTRLLYALQPFLSEKRRGRVDKAVRLLSLMRAVPMLRESGISLF